jgi:hypothetical protein
MPYLSKAVIDHMFIATNEPSILLFEFYSAVVFIKVKLECIASMQQELFSCNGLAVVTVHELKHSLFLMMMMMMIHVRI